MFSDYNKIFKFQQNYFFFLELRIIVLEFCYLEVFVLFRKGRGDIEYFKGRRDYYYFFLFLYLWYRLQYNI